MQNTFRISQTLIATALLLTPAQSKAQDPSVTVYSLDEPGSVIVPKKNNRIAPKTNITPIAPKTQTTKAPSGETDIQEGLWLGAKWTGRVNVGASIQTGNTEQEAFNLDTTVKAKWEDIHRASIKAEYNRESEDDKTTEDNKEILLQYDYFFRPTIFTNTSLKLEQDDISDIDLRTTVGLGIGHQHFESDALNLQYILSATYLNEEFENGQSDNSFAAKWSLDYDQKIWDDVFQIFHEHELLVPTDETDSFIFDSKTGLRIPLKKGLVATGEVEFDHDHNPPLGVKKNDTTYSAKLGYEW